MSDTLTASKRRLRGAEAARSDVLAQYGEIVDFSSNRRLVLDDPRVLWTVLRGAVDMFAVELREGEPHGRWHFLCRAEAGVSVLGFAHGPRHAVVIRSVRAARLRSTPLFAFAGISAVIADGRTEPVLRLRYEVALHELAATVDAGVTALGAALTGKPAPREFTPLDAGTEIVLDAGRSVRSLDDVVWTEIAAGRLLLRGAAAGARYAGELIPACAAEWYATAGPTTLRTVGSHELLVQDRLWRALMLNQARLLYAVDQHAEILTQQERRALVDGSTFDRSLTDTATRTLASVLHDQASSVRLSDVALDAPVLAAAKLVGARLRLSVVAAAADSGRSRVDPLQRIALASRIRTRTVRLSGRWWQEDLGPMVGYRVRDGAPVALLPDRRGYAIVEPGSLRSAYVTQETAAELDLDATTFYRPLPAGVRKPLALLLFGMFGTGRDLTRLLVTLALVAAVGLAVPVVTGAVLGHLVPEAQESSAVKACVLLLAFAVVTAVLTLVQNLSLLRLEGRVDTQTQAALWDRLLSLPVSFFGGWTTGELSSIAMGITAIREALSGIAATALTALLVGTANLVLLVVVSPSLSLLVLGIVTVGVAFSAACTFLQVRAQRRLVSIDQALSARVFQLLNGIAKIRVAAAEARAYAHWSTMFASSRAETLRARRVGNALTAFNSAYFLLGSLVVFWAAGGFLSDALPTATFLVAFVAFNQLLASVTQLTGSVIGVLNVVPMFQNVAPVVRAEPEAATGSKDPGDLTGRLELNHVSFSYDGSTPTIDDLSLSIRPGDFVAVVGPTGCGKSTLLRLLLGFERPQRGVILYDDQDLSELDVAAVRRQCGVVLQSGGVFAGDMLSNIVGSGRYTVDDAWAAARMAGLDADIAAMPMGMHTVIADGGGALSSGQRQRLMIARALISRPRLVYFDEATSALDNPTQQMVAESTRRLRATRVVIAHRLSTVIGADRILVMDKGRVVQEGTYEELMEDEGGVFRGLVQRQVV